MKNDILCFGEILWDALPLGLFLGGAPFNVACHLNELGEDVSMVTRVGDDVLGREALRRLRARGISADLIQIDSALQTGFVEVSFEADGEPEYLIVEPAAWDAIEHTKELEERAQKAAALVFGTLAQRAPASRETIRSVVQTDALTVLDVNLRPPFSSREIVASSLQAADVAKLNDEELVQLQEWFDLPPEPSSALPALAERFECDVACVTLGADGALMWRQSELVEHAGFEAAIQDTVGAGDAFLAALLRGLLRNEASYDILEQANRLGAYVASQLGGTPSYSRDLIEKISAEPRGVIGASPDGSP